MICLLAGDDTIVGYLDGDDCKDLNNKILGFIKRDDTDQKLHHIQNPEYQTVASLYEDKIQGKDNRFHGYVRGNNVLTSDYHIIGRVEANDNEDANDIARACAVLFWFFDLSAFY